MSEPVVLSASSIGTYLRCGQQWYYAYVERIKRPPTVKQLVGIATHDAVEVNYQQKKTTRTDLPVSDVLDAFSDSYDAKSIDVEPEDDEDPKTAKDSGVAIVRLYQQQVAPPIQPTHVEEAVAYNINGVDYSGYIDLVDEDDVIHDTKTTSRTPSDTTTYALAMTGYTLGYRQMTGKTERDVVLDFLIRTKTPKYLPVSMGAITSERILAFGQAVEQVSKAINAGMFLPNGLFSNACSWCGYKDLCPAYKAATKS